MEKSRFEGQRKLPAEELDWGEGKTPYVGMGGTLGGFGIDRHPVTVMKVSDDAKTVWVVNDDYERTDKNGMSESQSYDFFESKLANDEGQWSEYTLRKNGHWVHRSEDLNKGSKLWLGFRQRWYNFSY